MTQTKQELEAWYATPDPWGYQKHPDDMYRKVTILSKLHGKSFERALDIGCGEGWITQDLPAKEIHGLELSENARKRLSPNVKGVTEPEGKYDLIVLTGGLYSQYDYEQMTRWIVEHASGLVLTCNIEEWEINRLPKEKLFHQETFPYREYTQHLCLYDFSTT